jgi:hypothetical protein
MYIRNASVLAIIVLAAVVSFVAVPAQSTTVAINQMSLVNEAAPTVVLAAATPHHQHHHNTPHHQHHHNQHDAARLAMAAGERPAPRIQL